MIVWLLTAIIIPAILIILGIVFMIKSKDYIYNRPHTDGKYMGLGMLIGLGGTMIIGGLISFITQGNIEIFTFSPAVGVLLGVGIGSALEKKYGKVIELTEQQKKTKWILTLAGVGLLILGVIAGVLVFLLYK